MKTIKPIHDKVESLNVECEYIAVVVAKNDAEDVYGIAARDAQDDKLLCIREIGTDKERTVSIVDILNHHRVPCVHFFDVVNDLMNE
ncbi:MAG: hypothetical protein J6A83_07710 [Clostridia bacterium]|nr:hypothetical protein [Clostridia bacterium]